MKTFKAGLRSLKAKPSGGQLENEDDVAFVIENSRSKPSLDTRSIVFANCIKKDLGVEKQELEAAYTKNFQESLKVKDWEESYELIEMDPVGCTVFKQSNELCFEYGSPWIGDVKSEPWWRTADGDELASCVAQRLLELLDNCDLPQPRKHMLRGALVLIIGVVAMMGFLPLLLIESLKLLVTAIQLLIQVVPELRESVRGSNCSVEGNSESGIDRPIGNNTSNKETAEMQISEKIPSKAQLLEALRLSQTRAREAEKVAKQTYVEKENVTELFFKQASHLFACKQWFQLLQLENLYFQIKKNKNYPISALFPAVLPWVPQKTRKIGKNWQKDAKRKRGKQGRSRCHMNKYALMFALGSSLVGAGFFLGWTVGWMLPAL